MENMNEEEIIETIKINDTEVLTNLSIAFVELKRILKAICYGYLGIEKYDIVEEKKMS